MIFYLCKQEDGSTVLAPTQAEARTLDRNYKQIDVPTGKAELMAFLNDLYGKLETPTVETVEDKPFRPMFPNQCPGCKRSPKAALWMSISKDATALEEFICEVGKEQYGILENIISLASNRQNELS